MDQGSSFDALVSRLVADEVRFVVIGVWGDNLHAASGGLTFRTYDRDLFLPPDPWTRAEGPRGLLVDLTLVMGGFEFDPVWRERREFVVSGIRVPVARLMHIVTSKALAGRPKDHLFLATHAEALRELLPKDAQPPTG